MNSIIVEIENLNNEIILTKKYLPNTNIHTIKNDLFDLLPFLEVSLVYNDKQLYDHILISQITNDKQIKLLVLKDYTSIYKYNDGNYLIEYYKSKLIIIPINKLSHPYICKLQMLKIVEINLNNILILTIDYLLYSLKINNKYKFTLKKRKDNIKYIFYTKYNYKKENEIFSILTINGIIEIKLQNTKYIIDICDNNIDINNIKNINNIANLIYIETYDNTIFIYKINHNDINFYIKYENVKKIVYTFRDVMILTNNGILHYLSIYENSTRYKIIYDNKIFNNKFIDIQSRSYKSFFVGLLENHTILLFGNDIKNDYIITNELQKYLIDIKEVKLCDGFMYILTKDNIAIIWGPTIKKNDKPYLIIENVINIYSFHNELLLITNINITIINSTYYPKYSINTLTNPLLYENILTCYVYCGKIFLIKNDNKIIELVFISDSDSNNDSDNDSDNSSSSDRGNYYNENNIKYRIENIIKKPIKKFIFSTHNYLYIDINNNIIVKNFMDRNYSIKKLNNLLRNIYII